MRLKIKSAATAEVKHIVAWRYAFGASPRLCDVASGPIPGGRCRTGVVIT